MSVHFDCVHGRLGDSRAFPSFCLLFELYGIDGIRQYSCAFLLFGSDPLILRIDNSVVYPYLLAGRQVATNARPLSCGQF